MAHFLDIKICDTCPNKKEVCDYYEKVSIASYQNDTSVIELCTPIDTIFEFCKYNIIELGIVCIRSPDMDHTCLEECVILDCTPLKWINHEQDPIICKFFGSDTYTAKIGDCVARIVATDNVPIRVRIVDTLPLFSTYIELPANFKGTINGYD